MLQSKLIRKLTFLAILSSSTLLVGCQSVGEVAPASEVITASPLASQTPVVKANETLSFVNINPAIQFSSVYGQFSEGAHGTIGRFPPNFKTPFHIHSGAYHGVVTKGKMTNPFENEINPPVMEPGSYWFVPAGTIHATACVSNTPCEWYWHAGGAFDFTPIEE